MEYLIGILIVGIIYLRWHMNKEFAKDDQFDKIKTALDNALEESPYKTEPLRDIIVKKRTRKKTGRVKQPKVVKVVPKKKVTKRKTKKKGKKKKRGA